MKKHIARVSFLLIAILVVFTISSCSKVKVAEEEIVAVFKYDDANITKTLSGTDADMVRKIFNGKNLFSDYPSCGFSEDVALVIDGNIYCIACDTCGTIYDVKKDKYFNLSDEENEALRNMLCEYGFRFPCL